MHACFIDMIIHGFLLAKPQAVKCNVYIRTLSGREFLILVMCLLCVLVSILPSMQISYQHNKLLTKIIIMLQ